MRTGSLKGGFGEAEKSDIAVDEVRELRDRVHLLTEENHVLFE